MIQPSTGKEIRYRPFLVKEEKVMLLASESQNMQDVLRAVVNTITACCENVDGDKLTSFDIEYMFVKLRAKSVGESSNVIIKCQACDHGNPYSIDLDGLEMVVPEIEKKIALSDQIYVELQWPNFEVLQKVVGENTGTSQAEYLFALIRGSIAAVLTEEERIDLKEVSVKEIDEFIESMNTEQFGKIRDVIEKIPSLKHDVDFTCESCGHKNELVVQGMENFFS
jgi:DNA-directed RNA polymerase subunit M/transcription elongation factor TFIIS